MLDTSKDKIDVRRGIAYLVRLLPNVLGNKAQPNTIKNLIDKCASDPSILVQLEQGPRYKIHLLIKGETVRQLGFPTNSLELIVDQYAKDAWSFIIRSEEKGNSYFALEWNNDLSFILKGRKKVIASSCVLMDYRIHHFHSNDVDYHFKIGSNQHPIIDCVRHHITWHMSDAASPVLIITPQVNVQGNITSLQCRALPHASMGGSLGAIKLQIPISIIFSQ
ncbi:MAG: hypothetical protein V1922_01440 [bacterium]